ncbi:MAG: hypothetical protein GY750_06550, partial [Lentisphaerae bacterium]|nr:hypothetical protein [Lentisphaerota bacterium]
GEMPIAEKKLYVSKLKKNKMFYLYQSQLDALLELVRQRPDIMDKMAEVFDFLERDPEGCRETMLQEGLPYEPDLHDLWKKNNIGDTYTSFCGFYTDYIWKNIRGDYV